MNELSPEAKRLYNNFLKIDQELADKLPSEPLVFSKESFKSQFFLVGTDNNDKIEFNPQQVGPNLINQIIKMVADLEAGKRIVIRALKVDTKEEIEQRNKVLPESTEIND